MQNKTFRLFISSPFSDFIKEREVLHTKVFPKVEKYCNENGYSFQPIDLRWGVSNEAQLDQKTLEVCLEEVRACKHFPYPNFLIMAGDRYGYVPLPYMIEKNEFESIIDIIKNEDEIQKLKYWYHLDKNQIYIANENLESKAYILQIRTDEYVNYLNWEKQEILLREILQKAANLIFIDKKDKEYQKYFLSATEQEAIEGICQFKNKTEFQKKYRMEAEDNVFGYIRNIENANGKYADLHQDKADKFKKELIRVIDKSNLLKKEHATFSTIEEYENSQLLNFEEFMLNRLNHFIYLQLSNISNNKNLEQKYLDEQELYLSNKHKIFLGRKSTLNIIYKFLSPQDDKIDTFIMYSKSGYGKSALLYHLSKQKKSIIYRNLESNLYFRNYENLLTSIEYSSSNGSVHEIVIDGIEYLNIDDIEKLIESCKLKKQKLILSTNSNRVYKKLTNGKSYINEKLSSLVNDNSFKFNNYVLEYLKLSNRTLSKTQIKIINNQQCANLYDFNLLLDLLKNDNHLSDLTDITVVNVVSIYVNERLKYLEKDLIKYFLDYLRYTQIGLTEYELLLLLSNNKIVIDSIKNDFHILEEEKLPISIWSMLVSAMKPFIEIKYIDGEQIYSLKNNKILDFYTTNKEEMNVDIGKILNPEKNNRTLLETSYALLYSNQFNIFFDKFMDIDFLIKFKKDIGLGELSELVVNCYEIISKSDDLNKYIGDFVELYELILTLDLEVAIVQSIQLTSVKMDAINFLKYDFDNKKSFTNINPYRVDILKQSIEWNSKKIFDFILPLVADINIEDMRHHCPITFATMFNRTYMTKRLIELNAKLDVNNIYNWPSLLFVSENLNIELLKLYIKKNADLNINADGETPLLLASLQSDDDKAYEYCKILLDNEADVDCINFSKPRTYEEKMDGLSQLRMSLDNKFDYSEVTDDSAFKYSKDTPLIRAIFRNNIRLVKLLLENGANVNYVNALGNTPLLLLCKNYNNLEMLKLLLEYGADLSIKDEKGYDSRLYTISEKKIDLMNYLFDIGEIPYQLNLNTHDIYLTSALDSDNVAYFKKLHNNGVDLQITNQIGRNLLYIASDSNAKNCLKYFIDEIGLDLNIQSKSDLNTPLNFLFQNETLTKERVEECIEKQRNSEEKKYCLYDTTKLLLDSGANPNLKDISGYTPLFWALSKDLYEICELLVESGADPDIAISSGTTPFVYAAAKCDLKYLELLLPFVKDINARGKNGVTALMGASHIDPMLVIEGQSHFSKVKFLLDNKADITLVSDAGKTAYDYAIEPDVHELLENYGTDSSKIRLTNKNTVAIIDSLESDKIYSLYVDDYKENRSHIKDLLKNTYEHIATLITKGDFEEAKEYANNLGNIISLELAEFDEEINKIYNYIIELIIYNINVSKIHSYLNSNNYSIENFIEYFCLVSKSYKNNQDLWWSSYIACCINTAHYFKQNNAIESSIFAQEALNEINEVEKRIHNNIDYDMLNQFKAKSDYLKDIINQKNNYQYSLLQNESVLDNKYFLAFIENNLVVNKNYVEPLNSLLYIAKGLSIKYNNSDNIRPIELYNALHSVELNFEAEKVFRQIFRDKYIDKLNEDTDGNELIKLAKNHPKIQYDADMNNLVSQLKEVFGDDLILNIRK